MGCKYEFKLQYVVCSMQYICSMHFVPAGSKISKEDVVK